MALLRFCILDKQFRISIIHPLDTYIFCADQAFKSVGVYHSYPRPICRGLYDL